MPKELQEYVGLESLIVSWFLFGNTIMLQTMPQKPYPILMNHSVCFSGCQFLTHQSYRA